MKSVPEISKIVISDSELKSFNLAVKTRFGMDFSGYEKKSLKRGLVRLIHKQGYTSMLELWGSILKAKGILIDYIDELLVNLTEFFRNTPVWLKLQEDIIPQLRTKNTIDIWHAGCSTGEEVYSMAILLKEHLLTHKTQVLATDLSTKALMHAKKSSYNNLLFPKYKKAYLNVNPQGDAEKYIEHHGESFEIMPFLKKNISFQKHNLVSDKSYRQFDIIFCRNVMIYFDDALKLKVLNMFRDSLKDDGFLIIGYYDMLPLSARDLFQIYCSRTRIYTKK